MTGIEELHSLIAGEGGLLAGALRPGLPAVAGDADVVAAAVHEGYLLHYGGARILDPSDGDLALLAGDRCYAIGLELLAQRGDLEAVRRFATLIAEAARAQAAGDLDGAEALWQETATAPPNPA